MPEQRELVSLAADLLAVLKQRRRRLAVAESCTGGLVGHLLTEVPGSSDVFLGGAVSSAVAEAMATGIRKHTGTSLGLAVTGIAGPNGGSEAKPVGLTYVAIADDDGVVSEEHIWRADRSTNKQLS